MKTHNPYKHERTQQPRNQTQDLRQYATSRECTWHRGLKPDNYANEVSTTLGSMRTPGLIVDEIVMRFK
jgi:hypothetical protein